MELRGRVAVVTGGASGIGRALAERFAAEGARGVVVADLDGDGAAAAAAEIGGDRALGLACDVTCEDDLAELLAQTREAFGPVDLFCANAGIGTGAGLDAADELWERALAVNVLAHVVAARLLVPDWLQRGEGYFLSTASAAGLITQIGDAPYAVTKHAAVAFAEWLAITYGDRGVRVSCLCPMAVDTPLLTSGVGALAADVVRAAGVVLSSDEVAEAVVEGVRDERFLILPHPEVLEFVRRKASDHDRWLVGMRRLQATVAVSAPAADG